MKNNFLWPKTLLSVYRYLERISGAIDKIILQSGLNGGKVGGLNFFYCDTFTISQKIIDLSERKVTLINLKILIENTLEEMNEDSAQILIEKFFDGAKARDLTQKHDISMRTVFRKIETGLYSFSSRLLAKGYSDAKLSQILKNEGWINNVYHRFAEKDEENFLFSNVFLEKAVSM